MTDIYYVLRKFIQDDFARRDLISLLINSLEVLPLDVGILKQAISSKVLDYEDAVIDECALASGADVIVTNDKHGFDMGKVKPVSPVELVEQLGI